MERETLVARMAVQMEAQLRANEHKGGWPNCHPSWLCAELTRNLAELQHVILRADYAHEWSRQDAVRRCANIANFAAMIADNLGALPEVDQQATP